MRATDQRYFEGQTWPGRTRRRLAVTLVLAALLVAAIIGLLRFDAGEPTPVKVEVRLLSPEPAEPVVDVSSDPEPLAAEPAEEPPLPEQPAEEDVPVESTEVVTAEPDRTIDWRERMREVAADVVAEQQRTYSVNPGFAERRRRAAIQFAASRAPRKKPIWENVETDQLGRKILVSGNCHRVIDDPSAVNYDIFRTFQQYIVYCMMHRPPPRELPWVEEVRQRHGYLARQDDVDDGRDSDAVARLH